MSYELVGQLCEVCTCEALCPCWEGQDPDGGTCAFSWAVHFDRGMVEGHDVSGLRMGFLGYLPGNPLEGDIRLAVFIDERASEDQQSALLRAYTGELGGPLADLANLVGEVVAVERAPIEWDVTDGSGQYRIGNLVSAQMEGFASPEGKPTMLTDMLLSPVLGSPGYPGKPVASVDAPQHGFRFKGNSSIQTHFHYVAD